MMVVVQARTSLPNIMKNTTTKNTVPTELIEKNELAKRLHCTGRHIDNLTNRGLFKRIKLGAVSRYDWLEVVNALKSQ